MTRLGAAPVTTGVRISDLIRRPEVKYDDLEPFDREREHLPDDVKEKVEIEIKYSGYINRQLHKIEEIKKLEQKLIPSDIDYSSVKGLRLEAVEKLNKVRPANIGQASRISGVSPADVTVLLISLEKKH